MLKYIKFWQTISILHQRFFANIRCLFTLSFCAPSVRSHKSNGRAFFVYTSMAAAQRSAAHLMQQLFDSACHVYCKCVSTYKPCLGNNMCEFSCCNCSPFLFFSVSFTNTTFYLSLSLFLRSHSKALFVFTINYKRFKCFGDIIYVIANIKLIKKKKMQNINMIIY